MTSIYVDAEYADGWWSLTIHCPHDYFHSAVRSLSEIDADVRSILTSEGLTDDMAIIVRYRRNTHSTLSAE